MSVETSCDIVVVGGSLVGCYCALGAAASGKRVVLVEHGTYLGRELTSRLRPWVGQGDWEKLPEDLRHILTVPEVPEADADPASLPEWARKERPLLCGAVKKRLLARLIEAGVDVFFMCRAAGLSNGPNGVNGVLLASKHGLLLLSARTVVDATEAADLHEDVASGSGLWSYSIGYAGVRPPENQTLAVPRELGLSGNAITLHAGAGSLCSLFAEFAFAADRQDAADMESRRLTVELTRYLTSYVPEFASARLCEIAAESVRQVPVGVDASAAPVGLLRLSSALPADMSCADLAELCEEATALGRIAAEEAEQASVTMAVTQIRTGHTIIPMSAFEVCPYVDPKLGVTLDRLIPVRLGEFPSRSACDVLVAGGGTAGANAAVAAASHGAETVVVEVNPDLGGTQTLGMVSAFYHGYKGGYTERQEEAFQKFCSYMQPNGKSTRWLAKLLFYDRTVAENGVTCLLNTAICGGLVQDAKVGGVLAADADGLFRLEAAVTIDATGDGDVAAFCGAETTFGNPRNGNVQDYSQWSRGKGAWGTVSTHLDLDVIDQRLLSETLRGLRISHRKGYDFDFAPMLTVREGRHVIGDYVLNMVDILEGRTFDDGIAEAQTDWDPHGISSSWLGRLGFLPVHCDSFYVQIPYRACLPKGLSGLLISAKAISATTDAACLCRMAADVQNLGWATGIAAAEAARLGGDPRVVDVCGLRRELVELGILRQDKPAREKVSGSPRERVQRLAQGDEAALLDVAVLQAEQALPELRIAFDKPDADRLNVARGLAWFGDASGAELLRMTLDELGQNETVPYDDMHPHKEGNPRAGIVDEIDDYWRINQFLVLLGLIQDSAAVPTVLSIIERTWSGGEPVRQANAYVAGRIDMQRVPHFDRLLCIAFCVDRLACPELVEAMEFLLDRNGIAGHMTVNDEDLAGPVYHDALAEVSLAAAAARCGSRKGVSRLIDFLDDLHEILSGYAHAELTALADDDLGRDTEAWRAWLKECESLVCRPVDSGSAVF